MAIILLQVHGRSVEWTRESMEEDRVTNHAARDAAADALMEALEEWAASLSKAGVRRSEGARYFPSRQMERTMRQAHREGVLFERLTEWLPRYRFRASSYTERMKDIVRHGAVLWESVVAAEDQPWSPYIHPDQRKTLHKVVADIHADIARGDRHVERLRRQLGSGSSRGRPSTPSPHVS